jgi:hypothetical protein
VLKRINEIIATEVTRGRREPHNIKWSDFCSSTPPPKLWRMGEMSSTYIRFKKKIHTSLKWKNTEGRDGMEDTGMGRSIILN